MQVLANVEKNSQYITGGKFPSSAPLETRVGKPIGLRMVSEQRDWRAQLGQESLT